MFSSPDFSWWKQIINKGAKEQGSIMKKISYIEKSEKGKVVFSLVLCPSIWSGCKNRNRDPKDVLKT